ncbi:hypothetical protein [Tsukamurella pseudospumae]|uniref:hypothetical protein n=1 Tax=Tsukamurella pseudospumae TaxID=239498 RepID=UPI000A98A21B|nr:hypothetical protein [Tsukamurella pseudospumae]
MTIQSENDINIAANALSKALSFEEGGAFAFRLLGIISATLKIANSWELWGPTDADHEEDFPEHGVSVNIANGPESLLAAMAKYDDSDDRSGWAFFAENAMVAIDFPIWPILSAPDSDYVHECRVTVRINAGVNLTEDAVRDCFVQISQLVAAQELYAVLSRDSKYGKPPLDRAYFHDEPSDDYLHDVGWLNAYPADTPLDRTLLPPHARVWDDDGYVFIQLNESPNALTHSDIDALFQAQEAGIAQRR